MTAAFLPNIRIAFLLHISLGLRADGSRKPFKKEWTSALRLLAGTTLHHWPPLAPQPGEPGKGTELKSGKEAAGGLTHPVLGHSDHGWAGLHTMNHREL